MGDLFSPTALAAGMLLLLNPCSFALLPSYIGLFLNLENSQEDTKPNILQSVSRAQIVSFIMSAGLLAVFLPIGLAFTGANAWLGDFSYWLSIGLGVVLTILGLAMVSGYNLALKLPKFSSDNNGKTFWGIFLYGVSYATAALGCSLPVVIVGLTAPIGEDGLTQRLGLIISFAIGMVVALTTLTLAVATGRTAMVNFFRKIMTKMNLITGIILIPAGLYLAWYGWWSLDPVNRAKGPIKYQQNWEADIRNWLDDEMFADLSRAAVLGILFILLNVTLLVLGYLSRSKETLVNA